MEAALLFLRESHPAWQQLLRWDVTPDFATAYAAHEK